MSYYTSHAVEGEVLWTSISDTASCPIGEENSKAIDRCVGPADLFSPALDLPWSIVAGGWAEQKPELLSTLRQHGTSLLVDTHGWRYRCDATLDVAKLRTVSWAPESTVSVTDRGAGRALVEASLRAQADLEADAYFLPGWLPSNDSEDLRPAYEQIVSTAAEFDDVPPKPFVNSIRTRREASSFTDDARASLGGLARSGAVRRADRP